MSQRKLCLFDIQFKYNDNNIIQEKNWLDLEKFKNYFHVFFKSSSMLSAFNSRIGIFIAKASFRINK
jgi:DNA-binding GntR family transcriptional regulator